MSKKLIDAHDLKPTDVVNIHDLDFDTVYSWQWIDESDNVTNVIPFPPPIEVELEAAREWHEGIVEGGLAFTSHCQGKTPREPEENQ